MIRKMTRRDRRGFTLIELLVVILILGILMAIALPLYLNSVANSERVACRSNMQTIGNAIHAQRVATRGTYPAPGAVTLAMAPDLLSVPNCPLSAGTYSVAAGTNGAVFNITCSNGGTHVAYQYGVDSQ